MTDPPLSVLLPVRDGAEHLREAIASLEAQTMPDFEVLAVDDGSTDETPAVLHQWAARDERVRVLVQEPGGIVSALESARAEARAGLLARMDADDVCDPTRFAKQMALLKADARVTLVGCGVEYFPRDALGDGARRYEGWINGLVSHEEMTRDIFVECPIAHPSFFMRAEAVEALGGYRERGWPEDYDLLLRMWRAGGRLAKVDEPLLRWREGEERLSRGDPSYSHDAFRRCKAHHFERAFPAARDGVVIWGAGPVGKALSRALGAVGVQLLAFVEVDPRKIGQEIHGVPVLDTASGTMKSAGFHLGAVGQPGARDRLRKILTDAGFRDSKDFVLMA